MPTFEQHRNTSPQTVRPAYLVAAGRAGVEFVGRCHTRKPSTAIVQYGYWDQYGFNPLGFAMVSRDPKWYKNSFIGRHYPVRESEPF